MQNLKCHLQIQMFYYTFANGIDKKNSIPQHIMLPVLKI